MCGIAGIILKQKAEFNLAEKIASMTNAISHRGPDGEGFILANEQNITPHFNKLQQNYKRTDLNYIPKTSLQNSESNPFSIWSSKIIDHRSKRKRTSADVQPRRENMDNV